MSNLDKNRIREIFVQHGFTVKEGQTDLKGYVYDAANSLIAADRAAQADEIAMLRADEKRLDWLADVNNHIGIVQLPTKHVLANPHSLRAAIDDAMKEQP